MHTGDRKLAGRQRLRHDHSCIVSTLTMQLINDAMVVNVNVLIFIAGFSVLLAKFGLNILYATTAVFRF